MTPELQDRIQKLLDDHRVVLFMKGTRMFPQCGFSARAIDILKQCGVEFKDVNVLADQSIRDGIKEFSSWPTIPQVYVQGKFVGGSDILAEMFESGELHKVLGVEGKPAAAPAKAPKITISPGAQQAFGAAMKDAGNDVLRFDVSPSFAYDLYFGPKEPGDLAIDAGGLVIHVSPSSAARADGVSIDFVDGPGGAGFKIDNPNEPATVKNIAARELKALLDAGEEVHLYDVRGDKERSIAKIAQAKPLDAAGLEQLKSLPRNARIVLHCHHGVRSRSAGEQLVRDGYTNVSSLTGGIDAWASDVDPSVPRY
jgi:monothiol glutaredoxin